MEEMKKAVKYSLIFGICGAGVIPVIYEIYANVSKDAALWIFSAYVIFAGVKFSPLKAREAMLGMVCTAAYSGVLAIPLYLVIHPAVKGWLEKKSKYFQLDLSAQLRFLGAVGIIFLLMFMVWIARAGVSRAVKKLRSNSEKTGSYIENAFSENGEE